MAVAGEITGEWSGWFSIQR